MTSQVNAKLIGDLSAWFLRNNNPAIALGMANGFYQGLPGLVGYWPGWITNGSGAVADLSGNGNHLTRSNTIVDAGNEMFGRLYFSATTSYATAADASIFDVIGTEAHIASGIRGLTFGCWVNVNSIGSTQIFMSKYLSGTDRAYWLDANATGNIRFSISNTGSDSFTVTGDAIGTSAYAHIVARFDPSAELAIFVNGVKTVNTTSIPASLFNSTGPFRLGQRGDGFATGAGNRSAFHFLCAAALPDQFIEIPFEITAPLFGVAI